MPTVNAVTYHVPDTDYVVCFFRDLNDGLVAYSAKNGVPGSLHRVTLTYDSLGLKDAKEMIESLPEDANIRNKIQAIKDLRTFSKEAVMEIDPAFALRSELEQEKKNHEQTKADRDNYYTKLMELRNQRLDEDAKKVDLSQVQIWEYPGTVNVTIFGQEVSVPVDITLAYSRFSFAPKQAVIHFGNEKTLITDPEILMNQFPSSYRIQHEVGAMQLL